MVKDTEAGAALSEANSFVQNLNVNEVHHRANLALAVATPLAFVLSPSPLSYPVDLALGLLIPVHSHISLNMVAQDYVPPGTARSGSSLLIAALTILTLLGLAKVNMCGPGITESVKSLWREPVEEDAAAGKN